MKRNEVLERLRAVISSGEAIIGCGAGTGLSAKCAELGGADLIIIYNSGRYRMAGRGSLAGLMPYGSANDLVREMGREVLTIVSSTPVLAGICGTDPFTLMGPFLKQLESDGFAGVQNFPTVGLIDGVFREQLEQTGMSFQLEVDAIARAHEADLLTAPYVFDPHQAVQMANAGADVLVAHMGLTTTGMIGAQTSVTLDDCVIAVQQISDAALAVRPAIIVLCHGGPIANPEDAQYVLDRTSGVHGFFGASSIERLPTEVAITERVREFKRVSVPHVSSRVDTTLVGTK